MAEIRKLEPEDFHYLLTIEGECFSQGYSRYFLKMIPVLFGNTSYIAIEGQCPQGYVAAAFRQGSRQAWILSLAVRPRYRQLGIGKRLMQAGLRGLAAAGAREVFLSVSPGNQGAISLYLGLGFTVDTEVRDFFGPGETRLLMKKDLENIY
ncbi:MAG: GNAT family N-acetyltransferase [Bacillota bacterium]|nr:GNAT family N-acetyltransferase [Bacillota bacterium]HOC07199.1 N-acetyltransferase [Bacillota bacterium]